MDRKKTSLFREKEKQTPKKENILDLRQASIIKRASKCRVLQRHWVDVYLFVFRCSKILQLHEGGFSSPYKEQFHFLSKLIIQPSSPSVPTQTPSPSACLLFPSLSITSTSPLLSCHSHAPTTKVPRCLKSLALISCSKRGDPCGICLTNHCLKALWTHGRER